ncbi:hypothetical protein [Allosphingosinicella sp.]|jgi:hypothetical protein|uniref:hypothetical protein n=1 Tax=Allosphingosinicella sp. TaxID=2823234 RepID=UPI002F09301E
MTAFGRTAYRIFVFMLGIWTGAGIHDSLTNHFAWHADPAAYANRPTLPGMFSPWPFTTLLLLIATIAAGIVLWRYRGAGRRDALAAIGGTALILVATLAWFVPELGRMFGEPPMTGTELIAHSRTWIALNAVRIVALIALFYLALLALGRIAGADRQPGPRE